MPNVNLTEHLRNTIRDLRKEKKKRGDELSKEIGKGAAYISQIENGKIKEIDLSLLNKIFHKITDLSGEEYNNFLDDLLNETVCHMTQEELEHEEWVARFNYELRKIPITDSLVEFIKDKLDELNYTPEEFVNIINENRGLQDDTITEENKLIIKIIDLGNGNFGVSQSIRFNLPHDFIAKILSKETKTINYINMEGIIFNLVLFDNNSVEDASKKAEQLLYDNQFYTIQERNKLVHDNLNKKIENDDSFEFYDIQPTDFDKHYVKLKSEMMSGFDALRDRNIDYTCNRLEKMLKNMHYDLALFTAISAAPIYKIDLDKRNDFWKDYQELIKKYVDDFEIIK